MKKPKVPAKEIKRLKKVLLIKKYAKQGLSANKALAKFKAKGFKIRRQTFLNNYRAAKGITKQASTAKYTPKKYKPAYTPVNFKDPLDNYKYNTEVTYIDPIDGYEKKQIVSFTTEYERTINQAISRISKDIDTKELYGDENWTVTSIEFIGAERKSTPKEKEQKVEHKKIQRTITQKKCKKKKLTELAEKQRQAYIATMKKLTEL